MIESEEAPEGELGTAEGSMRGAEDAEVKACPVVGLKAGHSHQHVSG